MGGSPSRIKEQSPPEDIANFRKSATPGDEYRIPEVPEKRKVTDLKFTITLATCLGVLAVFLIYTLVHADFDRVTHGYDKCGNICGKKNVKVDGIPCSGVDMTDRTYLEVDIDENHEDIITDRHCVKECDESNYDIVDHFCYPRSSDRGASIKDIDKILTEIRNDVHKSASSIVLLCFIGLGACVGMLALFRYFPGFMVWGILIGSILAIVAITITFWVVAANMTGDNATPFQVLGAFFTVIALVIIVMTACMVKKIELVIRLFRESTKVIFAMPLILLEPLLTLAASIILFIVFVSILLGIASAGFLQGVGNDLYDYSPDLAMQITLYFHLFMVLWMGQFIIGCQHMVIGGAVSAFYFARNKLEVRNPLYNSFYNLIRYHLGTVAFGSLIITLVAVIKAMMRRLIDNKALRLIVDCCLSAIEDFLKYLSKNAYIQTAMHGQPFYKSGRRAVRLLAANFFSVIAVNSVGDFVLFMAKLLIVVATILIGLALDDKTIPHFWAAIVISALVTAIIAECFFAVFETAIDTLFLCFCEDSCMNDGMNRPYYMSRDLMTYMEDVKKTILPRENH